MCFGCSKEPSHWDGSFEYLQHMFWLRNKKNIFSYPLLFGGLPSLWFQELLKMVCNDGKCVFCNNFYYIWRNHLFGLVSHLPMSWPAWQTLAIKLVGSVRVTIIHFSNFLKFVAAIHNIVLYLSSYMKWIYLLAFYNCRLLYLLLSHL